MTGKNCETTIWQFLRCFLVQKAFLLKAAKNEQKQQICKKGGLLEQKTAKQKRNCQIMLNSGAGPVLAARVRSGVAVLAAGAFAGVDDDSVRQ